MKTQTWCNNLKCLFHHNRPLYMFRVLHPSSGASNMYNQVCYNLITVITMGVYNLFALHRHVRYPDTHTHQKHFTPLANSTTTRTVHWRARTTDAQNSVGWRLHIHGLIPVRVSVIIANPYFHIDNTISRLHIGTQHMDHLILTHIPETYIQLALCEQLHHT